jgi:hypothetical protein
MSLEALIQTAKKEGAIIDPRIKFEKTKDAGFSAFIDLAEVNQNDENSKSVSIEIPSSFIIKPEDAFKAFNLVESKVAIDFNIIFKFYLACIRNNLICNDKFKPYVDLLPALEKISSPLSMNTKSLYVFENTSLQESFISEKLESLKNDYESINELKLNGFQVSLNDYLWAHLIITSRAFPYKIIAPNAEPHLVMLLPVIDLLNHKPNSKVEWSTNSYGSFKFSNLNLDVLNTNNNQIEVYNNYGPKGNAELLMGYGFVLEDNEFETLQLSITLKKGLKENLSNDWNVKLPTLDDYTYSINNNSINESNEKDSHNNSNDTTVFLLNKFHPIAEGLIEVFSYINKNPTDEELTLKNLMNGLNQLKQSLELKFMNKLDKIPAFDANLITENDYRNAKIFRQGQLQIYNLAKNEIKNKEKHYLKKYRKHFITVKDIFKKDKEFEDFIQILQWDKEISELSKMEIELIVRLWLLKTVNYRDLKNIEQFSSFDIKWFLKLYNNGKKTESLINENDEFMIDLYNQIIPPLKKNVPDLIRGTHWELADWLLIDKLVVENSYEKGKMLELLLIKPTKL